MTTRQYQNCRAEPFHLFRYLGEQALRHNHRKDMNDSERLDLAARQAGGSGPSGLISDIP